MTAYEAFVEVLDINETIEKLKNANTGNMPDAALCESIDLLKHYRDLLKVGMCNTELKF